MFGADIDVIYRDDRPRIDIRRRRQEKKDSPVLKLLFEIVATNSSLNLC